MYKFPYFTESDPEKIIDFIKNNSFAMITGFDEKYPVTTHIPLAIHITDEGKIILSGHMMRKTDHHTAFVKNNHVLVVFNGPHCFVSASWYKNPLSGSTWNYMTVHAKGKINFTDEDGTINAVKSITDKYEGTVSAAAFNNLPKEYIDSMVKAIVGFTIEVESIDNVFKLSQNHDASTRQNIIAQLNKRNDENSRMIAAEIESRLN